jgi:hypothetical protein
VGKSRPPQKLALRKVITFWANEVAGSSDDLPEGIHDLRNALHVDLPVDDDELSNDRSTARVERRRPNDRMASSLSDLVAAVLPRDAAARSVGASPHGSTTDPAAHGARRTCSGETKFASGQAGRFDSSFRPRLDEGRVWRWRLGPTAEDL